MNDAQRAELTDADVAQAAVTDSVIRAEVASRIRAMAGKRTHVGKTGDRVPNDPLARTITIYELATGKSFTVWPVDARQMCASGAFSLDAPPPEVAPVEDGASHTDAAVALAADEVPEADTKPTSRKKKG